MIINDVGYLFKCVLTLDFPLRNIYLNTFFSLTFDHILVLQLKLATRYRKGDLRYVKQYKMITH